MNPTREVDSDQLPSDAELKVHEEAAVRDIPIRAGNGRLQRSGFTLVELMGVTAVLAILAAIIIPNLRGLIAVIQANAAIREIASNLQWAKMKAVADNNDYWIVFDAGSNSYSIYDDNCNNGLDDDDGNGNFDDGGNGDCVGNDDDDKLVNTIVIPDEHKGIQYGYVPGTQNTSNPPSVITSEITFSNDRVRFYSRGTANSNGSLYLIPAEDLSAGKRDRMRAITVIQTGRIRVYRYDSSRTPPWK